MRRLTDQFQPTALILLVLSAFAWRVQGLTAQSFWRDEVDAVYLALRPWEQTLSMFWEVAQNGPLYFVVLRPWLILAGTTEFSLRYLSAIAGTLSVPLAWQVARRLLPGDSRPALANGPWLVALFIAFNPYQLWYSQEGKMYSIIVCLALLSSWSWLDAIQRGGVGRWLPYWALTTASMYTHFMMLLIIPLHFLWFWIAWPHSRRRWLGYFAALAGLTLPYSPMVWWQWGYLTSPTYETGYSFVPLPWIARALILNHTQGLMPVERLYWLIPIFFLALTGLFLGIGELRTTGADKSQAPTAQPPQGNSTALFPALSPWPRYGLIVSWLVVPVLLIYAISTLKPIFVDRYILWIGPAFAMLLALGIRTVRSSTGRAGSFLAAGLLAYTLAFWLYAGWQERALPLKTQLREAVTFVAEHRDPQDLLILQIPHLEYAYRYYTSDFGRHPFQDSDARLDPWTGGIWTYNGRPDAEAADEVDGMMREKTNGYREVWLLLSEASMWDSRRLMDRWLDTHGTLVEQRQFHGVEARHYRLQP